MLSDELIDALVRFEFTGAEYAGKVRVYIFVN